MKCYDTIIVGGGAAGLYCAAHLKCGSTLLLEKTNKPGTKLLMSGGGQCNLTHGGNIKDFLTCYGDRGSRIRTTLYAHNNLAVCDFFASSGVNITEREDGKIFPASMDAHEVLDALLAAAKKNGVEIRTGSDVTRIEPLPSGAAGHPTSADAADAAGRYRVSVSGGQSFICTNLVIAAGGCSYPTTGSDGSMFSVLQRDLGLEIVPPVPALTPVFVENYLFGELSGISFQNVEVTIYPGGGEAAGRNDSSGSRNARQRVSGGEAAPRRVTGDLLLTHRNLSGPVILNHSRFMKTGTRLAINYLFPYTIDSMLSAMKKEFTANPKTIEHWLAEHYGLPKRFCEVVCRNADLAGRKVSTLSGEDMKHIASRLCEDSCVVSGLGSFRQAMVTAGGVSLGEISPKTMGSKNYPGLYIIGEMVDVDGDTGGYNLQFAFSSAAAAARAICGGPEKKK